MATRLIFPNEYLENEITNIVIPSIFPSLNKTDIKILSEYTIKLINIISYYFQFDIENKYDDYVHQFIQNDYQDIRLLVLCLLPYINTNSDKKQIYSFNDIYIKKKTPADINKKEPEYMFSNLQFNRCIRKTNEYQERQFMYEDLEQNYNLIIESIQACSNKLCVNWINILPYTIKDYFKTKLYVNTITKQINKELKYHDHRKEKYNNLAGDEYIYIGHIYNEIVDLYYSIEKWKWIILNLPTQHGNIITVTQFLQKLFKKTEIINITTFLQLPKWTSLTDEQKNIFIKQFDILKNYTANNISPEFTHDTYKYFINAFISGFDHSYYKRMAKEEKYIPDNDLENDDDYDDDDDENVGSSNTMISLNSLKYKFCYDFIAESLTVIKQTWYGYILFNDEKTDLIDIDDVNQNPKNYEPKYRSNERLFKNDEMFIGKDFDSEPEINIMVDKINNDIVNMNRQFDIQLKNIYNYAKSFCRGSVYFDDKRKKNVFYVFPKHWCSLIQKEKDEIIMRINGLKNPLDWFRIDGYIKKFNIYDKFATYFSENKIGNSASEKKIKVYMTNLIIYDTVKRMIIDIVFQSLIHKGILTIFVPDKTRSDKNLLPKGSYDYISTISQQQNILAQSDDNKYWTGAYHYLTMQRFKDIDKYEIDSGNGSETYTFFSYCLKNKWYTRVAYDWIIQIGFCYHFINNLVIFLTAPTGVGKSTEIPKLFLYYSKAIDYNNNSKIACIQPRINAVKISKYVSDTLGVPIFQKGKKTEAYYIQFGYSKDNHTKNVAHPVLEYMTGDTIYNKLLTQDPSLVKKYGETYSNQNIYDTIIIDESHEHEIYMDLLMTYLKTALYVNNGFRLVIITATMDDDEYRYRRFYRDINDNKKYPLNSFIKDNQLDRINVDRRYHASLPTNTTQYQIKETYMPIKNRGEDDTAENDMILKIILKITNEIESGNILIFEPGENEIKTLVKILNNKTKNNVIALPFYSALPEPKLNVIREIDEYKNKITLDKHDNYEDVEYDSGRKHYDIFLIVSTSIAEASVTIPNLKYVIDTGTVKKPIYDYVRKNQRLEKREISESSRIQRKGRIGRQMPGEIYYLYEKDKMKNNKIQYTLAQINISDKMYQLLKKKENEDPFMLLTFDFNNKKPFSIKYDKIDEKYKNFIQKKHFIDMEYYLYYGNDKSYDYDNYQPPIFYYQSGFNCDTLIDNKGEFYIIHPDETFLTRNINGDIVNTTTHNNDIKFKKIKNKLHKGYITSQKIMSFWVALFDYMYVGLVNNEIIRSNFGDFFRGIQQKDNLLLMNQNIVRTLIFGIFNKCENLTLPLCAMYDTLNLDITKLFTKVIDSQEIPTSTMASQFYKYNVYSDSDMLIQLLGQLHNLLPGKNIPDKLATSTYIHNTDLKENAINLDIEESILLLGSKDNYTEKLKNKIYTETRDEEKKIKKIIKKNYVKYTRDNPDILKWCDENHIDHDIINKYIEKLCELSLTSHTIKIEKKTEINRMQTIFTHTNMPQTVSSLKKALFFGFPHNFVKKVSHTEYYLSLYAPEYKNTYRIPKFPHNEYKTFIKHPYIDNYLFYLNSDPNKNEITFLHYVTPQEIMILPHIYHSDTKKNQLLTARIPPIDRTIPPTKNEDLTSYVTNQLQKYNAEKKENIKKKYINKDIHNLIINYINSVIEIETNYRKYANNAKQNLEIISLIEPTMKDYIGTIRRIIQT